MKKASNITVLLARRGLLDFITYTFPEYQVNWHHKAICDTLDSFVSGGLERVIIKAPPRHGKSEIVSRRLPAYIFGLYPDANVMATSYSADLAKLMNRDVQRIIESELYHDVFPNTKLNGTNVKTVLSSNNWLRNSDIFEIVKYGGTYRCAGTGGGITGMGSNFTIIDDPIKNQEQANSKVYREKLWEWYQSTLYTRLEKGGKILLTLTPWHDDDLSCRLLSLMAKDTYADQWQVLEFPAIKEKEADVIDPRDPDEALWPDKYDRNRLETIKRTLGSHYFQALYQCSPVVRGGGMIKLKWFRHSRYKMNPKSFTRVIQSWDTAQKSDEKNDFSVCTTWGESTDNRIFLIDVFRKRLEYPELKRAVVSLYQKYKPQAVLIEDKGNGTTIIQDLRYEIKAIAIEPKGNKAYRLDNILRADAETPTLESGAVWLPENADWLLDFESELESFPNGKNDDQVDSMTQYLNWLNRRTKYRKRTQTEI